jgi:hypothetical protein
MSLIKTQPVLLCKRCGRPVVVTRLATQRPDAEGTLLHEFMVNLRKIAYCPYHIGQYNHYASIGRLDDWLRGDV